MRNTLIDFSKGLVVIVGFALVTACGGGSSDGTSTDTGLSQVAPAVEDQVSAAHTQAPVVQQLSATPQVFIDGAGIKGPLAYAIVELYELDTSLDWLYEDGIPIASATTNAYAEITGLAIPAGTKPPYIMIVDGTTAIDQNTGQVPVIRKLITVITQESLNSGQAFYATPYTTVAFHMLTRELGGSNLELGSSTAQINALVTDYLVQFNQDIVNAIGFGMKAGTNIFSTPPIITTNTTSLRDQILVVNYRAAIEALAAMMYELSNTSKYKTDALLRRLARDLQSDGIINNKYETGFVGGIDRVILSKNPLSLVIPNTSFYVRDTVSMMDEEGSLIGAGSNVTFLKNNINVLLTRASLTSAVGSNQGVITTIDSAPPAGNTTTTAQSSPVIAPAPDTGYVSNNANTTATRNTTSTVGNTTSTLALAGIVASTPVLGGDIIFSQDLNAFKAGTVLSGAQIKSAFSPISSGVANNAAPEGVTIVPDPTNSGRGNAMRVFFPKGEFGNKSSGAAWQTKLPASNEYYFAYDMYVPVGFNFSLSCKIPGLFGGNLGDASGLKVPDGVSGFAVRQSIISQRKTNETVGYKGIGNGNIEVTRYIYNKATQRRKYNPDLRGKVSGTRVTPGKWVRIEQRVVLNDATSATGVGVKSNGIYEAWVNGVKVSYETNLVYRQNTSLEIDHISFIWYYGGNKSDFAAREDQYSYYDNFVVSTQPITH